MKKIIDKTFFIYVGLGILNYLFCAAVMLIFKNVANWSDTICLIISFALQTTISFVLNRFVTFRGIEISRYWPLLFVGSVATCYLLAKVLLKKLLELLVSLPFGHSIAQWLWNVPFIQAVFRLMKGDMDLDHFKINLILLGTTFIYCVINYIGQRYFVFRSVKKAPMPLPENEQ